jgi:predicted nucleic acid-binding protein
MAIPSPKLRVMVDANVLLAGHGWARWSFEVLRHTVAEDYQLVFSADVIDEVRKHISRRFPHLLERLEAFLTDVQYELVASPSEDEVKQHSGLVRDAKGR